MIAYPSYWQNFCGTIKKRVFNPSILYASDGYRLNVYEAGGPKNETIVIASPPTIPFLLMSKLAASLSRHYRVIAWETRGGPYLDATSDGFSLFIDRHAKDLSEILESSGTGPVHYVGWCGGSWIVCWAILKMNLPVASISLIAPNDVDGGQEQTKFQKFIAPIVKRVIGAGPDELDSICKVMRERKNENASRTPAERDLDLVADLNTGTVESIRKWARVVRDFGIVPGTIDEPIARKMAIELFDELCTRARLQILHSRDDDIVSYKCSLAASERNPCSKFVLYPVGGHSIAYLNEPALFQDIMSFIHPDH